MRRSLILIFIRFVQKNEIKTLMLEPVSRL